MNNRVLGDLKPNTFALLAHTPEWVYVIQQSPMVSETKVFHGPFLVWYPESLPVVASCKART